ncbi:MAG: hypothetical protein Q8O79_02835 [Pseudomonadota bacterium]|nr:hypothetical protein [Pseudomonadota bacterium]
MIDNGDVYAKQIDGVWHIDPHRASRSSKELEKDLEPSVNRKTYVPSLVVGMLYFISILSFLGGLLFSMALWPGDPGDGYGWKPVAYAPSIISISVGMLQFVLFVSIAKIIAYLGKIEFNTRT